MKDKDKNTEGRIYTEEEVASILRFRQNATTVMDEYQAIREWKESQIVYKEPQDLTEGEIVSAAFEVAGEGIQTWRVDPIPPEALCARYNLYEIMEATGTTNLEIVHNEDGTWSFKPEEE